MSDDAIKLPGSDLPEKWVNAYYNDWTGDDYAQDLCKAFAEDACEDCGGNGGFEVEEGVCDPCLTCHGLGSKTLAAAYKKGHGAGYAEGAYNENRMWRQNPPPGYVVTRTEREGWEREHG
ncbi:MAG: hypothetical protein ACU85V_00210 [Gammaproteobacteria bacterium]